MLMYSWLSVIISLIFIAIFVAIVVAVVKAVMPNTDLLTENEKYKKEARGNAMLKSVYLYLVLFVTLMMSIGGSVGVFVGLSNYVAPDTYTETYDQYKQARCDNVYSTPYRGTMDAGEASTLEEPPVDDAESEDSGITAKEDAEMNRSESTEENDTPTSSEDDVSVESSEMRIQPWPYPGDRYCDEAELRDSYDDMVQDLEDDEKGRAIKTMIQSLGWILIPLPIFIYFQRQLNQHTETKRRVNNTNEE